MILGVGIDSIEIERFSHWHTYSAKALQKVFAESEIIYCLENKIKSAERFAVRFAAKEAFFKALSQANQEKTLRGLKVFKHITINKKTNGSPLLQVNWKHFLPEHAIWTESLETHVSLTHTRSMATAIVIIEKN